MRSWKLWDMFGTWKEVCSDWNTWKIRPRSSLKGLLTPYVTSVKQRRRGQVLLRTLLGCAWNAVSFRIRKWSCRVAGSPKPITESMNSVDFWEETGRRTAQSRETPRRGMEAAERRPDPWGEGWCQFPDQYWDRDFWRKRYILLCVQILGPWLFSFWVQLINQEVQPPDLAGFTGRAIKKILCCSSKYSLSWPLVLETAQLQCTY